MRKIFRENACSVRDFGGKGGYVTKEQGSSSALPARSTVLTAVSLQMRTALPALAAGQFSTSDALGAFDLDR